jgi:large subunit ribosomal protein L15
MSLSQLKAPKGANRERKRVGRGQASGLGKTAGRGGKGQKARSGNMHFEGFEGGQMPLQRRLPKFGFNNVFRRELEEVQVARLDALPAGTVVDLAALAGAGLAKGRGDGVVVLGTGELKNAYTVKADRVTAGARAAIEKAGGKVEVLPKPQTMYEKERAARRAAAPPPDPEKAAKKAAQAAEKAAKAAAKAEKAPKAEKAEKPPKGEKSEKPKADKKPKEQK